MSRKFTDTIVWPEVQAFYLLAVSKGALSTADTDFHAAGNKIIELAEQIKAARAVSAMQDKG